MEARKTIHRLHHTNPNATTPMTKPEHHLIPRPIQFLNRLIKMLISIYQFLLLTQIEVPTPSFAFRGHFSFLIELSTRFLRDRHTNNDKNSTTSFQTLPPPISKPKHLPISSPIQFLNRLLQTPIFIYQILSWTQIEVPTPSFAFTTKLVSIDN